MQRTETYYGELGFSWPAGMQMKDDSGEIYQRVFQQLTFDYKPSIVNWRGCTTYLLSRYVRENTYVGTKASAFYNWDYMPADFWWDVEYTINGTDPTVILRDFCKYTEDYEQPDVDDILRDIDRDFSYTPTLGTWLPCMVFDIGHALICRLSLQENMAAYAVDAKGDLTLRAAEEVDGYDSDHGPGTTYDIQITPNLTKLVPNCSQYTHLYHSHIVVVMESESCPLEDPEGEEPGDDPPLSPGLFAIEVYNSPRETGFKEMRPILLDIMKERETLVYPLSTPYNQRLTPPGATVNAGFWEPTPNGQNTVNFKRRRGGGPIEL